MNWFARSLALLGVACALPGSALLALPAGFVDPPKDTAKAEVVDKQAGNQADPIKEAAKPAPGDLQGKIKDVITIKVEKVAGNQEAGKAQVQREGRKAVDIIVRQNAATNLEPWTQRFIQQLRPLHRAEVHLVLQVCQPTPEQRTLLAGDGEKVLKDVSLKCAEAQMSNQRNTSLGMPNPSRLIAEGMAVAVKDRLSPEQAERYRVESEAKLADFKRAAVANLVAVLDEELSLSAEQRGTIAGALSGKWNDSWCAAPQVLLYGSQYFPTVPDDLILPSLNPIQRQAWDKRQKFGNVFWGNFGFMGNAMIEEEANPAAKPGALAPAPAVEKRADRVFDAPKEEKQR